MKKFTKTILTFALASSILIPPVHAQDSDIGIFLNNIQIYTDVPVQVINGRTLLPARAILENLGLEVNWSANTRTVKAIGQDIKGNNLTIMLKIDSKKAKVNGKTKNLDVPAKIIKSRTMVPVRFVAEATQANVHWDGKERMVNIKTPASIEPEISQESIRIPDRLEDMKYIKYINGKFYRFMPEEFEENDRAVGEHVKMQKLNTHDYNRIYIDGIVTSELYDQISYQQWLKMLDNTDTFKKNMQKPVVQEVRQAKNTIPNRLEDMKYIRYINGKFYEFIPNDFDENTRYYEESSKMTELNTHNYKVEVANSISTYESDTHVSYQQWLKMLENVDVNFKDQLQAPIDDTYTEEPIINKQPRDEILSQEEHARQVLEFVNKARRDAGIEELTIDEDLTRTAQWKADYMAQPGGEFEHNVNGMEPTDQVEYVTGKHILTGENIHMSDVWSSPYETFNAYWNSPGHKRNMLDSRYHTIGLAYGIAANNSFRHSMMLGI